MRNSSPLRGTGVDYTSTSSLLQEITSLRARLRELEDDNKSSVISVNVAEENKLEMLVNTLRNEIAQVQQDKALQEKDFLNQMTALQADCNRQMNELNEALREKDSVNNAMNDKIRNVVLQNDELNDQLKMIKEERKTLSEQLQTITVQRDELSEKLQQAKIESAISRSKNDTEDKYTRLLEDQRESHLKEIEQMKQHLQNADMDIAESRTEMDQLHDEINDMQNYREALLEEVTTVRLDLSEEKRVSQNLRKEITDWKLKVERLQQEIKEKDIRLDHKSDGKKSTQEMDKVISSQQEEISRLRSRIHDLEQQEEKLNCDSTRKSTMLSLDTTNNNTTDTEDDQMSLNRPITPAERDQLVNDMQALEARLLKFHSKLADKENKIDDLTASLADELKVNKQLRAEIEQLKNSTAATKSSPTQPRTADLDESSDVLSEITQLKKQNKALTDEVEAMRNVALTKTKKGRPPSLLAPPTVYRTTTFPNHNELNTGMEDSDQPRTPVSGLVATFERHSMNNRGFSSTDNDMSHITESEQNTTAIVVELQQSLKREKRLVLDLQKQLRADKQTIWDLQEKLRSGKDHTLSSTSSKVPVSDCGSPTSLAAELRQSKKENEKLQAKLRETERNNAITVKERAELSKLRSEAVYANMERDDSEQMIKECREEIKRLQKQLNKQQSSKVLFIEEEKKSDSQEDDIADLQIALGKKEQELQKLREQGQAYEHDTEEELGRLRSQVDALQSELESAMTKIELMQTELSGRDRKSLERELRSIELELAASKTRHADLVEGHAVEMKQMEEKIKALETANEVLSNETPEHVRRGFEDETKSLNAELEKYQNKLLDLEMSSSLKIKDLENQIQSLQVELEEEKKEKDSLQKCLETSEAAATDAPKLNAEIDRLSSELTAAHLNRKNSDRENLEKLRALEDEMEILELEAMEEIEKRCTEIETLKAELERKEENIQRLEKEKQQLCLSMNDASFSRKGELEELQAELLDMTTRTKTQGREIHVLQMKLQEHENRKEEVGMNYQRKIRELEDEICRLNETARKISNDRDGILQLKSENAQLRETLRDVKIDRRHLKDKLDALIQDKTSTSRSSQLLRDRNNELQVEVEKLAKRLKKMEASLTRVEF
jgi:chromosome segregation ATPase